MAAVVVVEVSGEKRPQADELIYTEALSSGILMVRFVSHPKLTVLFHRLGNEF